MIKDELNPFTNTIEIKCEAADKLPISDLLDFQGGLKKLSEENRTRLVKSICSEGFMAPVFIWSDNGDKKLIDGHQRIKTLKYMQSKGWEIPLIPVVYIYAENEKEARRKLLKITSQYGEFDLDELNEWLDDF